MSNQGWISWGGGPMPVPAETYIFVKLATDTGNEGIRLHPQPAGRYKWTKGSGIVAYQIAKGWPHDQ